MLRSIKKKILRIPRAIKKKNVFSGKGTLYNPPIKLIPSESGIEFGKFCSIGPNLKIIGHNHDYNYPAVQNTVYRKYFGKPHPVSPNSDVYCKGKVKIGNDVWMGEDVVILSGVTVGDGCCIGARSVVTKNLKPYMICAGTPCKEIKKRYNDDTIEFLLKLKWWDWDDEKIKRNKAFFTTNLNDHDIDYIKKIIL